MSLTMEELKARGLGLSEEFIDTYGPAVIAMSSQEALNLIELLANGKELEAWALVLEKKSGDDALAEFVTITAAWNAENQKNASSLALQKEAITALLKGCLIISLALVGL